MGEIINLAQATNIVKSGQKRVLVGGCFDIIHLGHVTFLNKAKEMGDELWIILESDVTVKKLKGEKRPINSQEDRAGLLTNLRAVDYVVMLPEMSTGEDYDQVLDCVKPDIIVITEGDRLEERKTLQASKLKARLQIVPVVPNKSTSKIIELLI